MARKTDYSSIQPDRKNANKGTERGRYMVEASLRETGAGRSILLDKDGRIIAGNKTFEAASDIGLPVRIVQTDGSELVAVQRTDLDLGDDTGTARKLAYYDNRSGQVGLDFDPEQILADLTAGLDLSGLWFSHELDALMGTVGAEFDPAAEWQGMPEFENEDITDSFATVKVHIANKDDLERFAQLMGQTVTKESKWIWFPKRERMNLEAYRAQDES